MEKIPFDLERLKAGEVTVLENGIEFRFLEMLTPRDVEMEILNGLYAGEVRAWDVDSLLKKAHMKPTSPTESPWVNVPGDGSIPDAIKGAKAGEWEARRRSGDIGVINCDLDNISYFFNHSVKTLSDIVAVRRVRKEVSDGEVYATISAKDARPDLSKMVERLNKQIAEMIGMPAHMLSPSKKEKPARSETAQQALNRAAYLRYKAAHPDPLPAPPAIGADAIESAIFSALCESMRK